MEKTLRHLNPLSYRLDHFMFHRWLATVPRSRSSSCIRRPVLDLVSTRPSRRRHAAVLNNLVFPATPMHRLTVFTLAVSSFSSSSWHPLGFSTQSSIGRLPAVPRRSRLSPPSPPLSSPIIMMGGSKRYSSSKSKKKKKKKHGNQRNDRERNERIAKLKRMRNLHKAAKFKRILSATDYWFSEVNLPNDAFLQETLQLHKGYIPLSTLLTFPKFHYWTNLELLYEAYTCTAATKKYKIIFNPQLMQQAQREKELVRKQEQQKRKKAERLHMAREDRVHQREILWKELYQERLAAAIAKKRPQFLQEENEFIRQDRAEHDKKIQQALQEGRKLTDEEKEFPWKERTLKDVDDWEILEYYQDELEIQAHEEAREKFAEKYGDDDDDDDDDNDEDAKSKHDQSGKIINNNRRPKESKEEENDDDDDVFENFDDELWDEDEEEPIKGDGAEIQMHSANQLESSTTQDMAPSLLDTATPPDKPSRKDLQYALLKHKRVNLSYLERLERRSIDGNTDEEEEEDDGGGDQNTSDLEIGDNAQEDKALSATAKSSLPPKKEKQKRFKDYQTQRPIVVIRDSKKLANFCTSLRKDITRSMKANGDDPNASAVGFDVEYATLELDIRMTLPALLQLAGPTKNGPIGLIWLDKFPNHGKDMIGNPEYEPLLNLLADSSVLKVGVGASKDANHLAAWWGIDDREYTHDFIAGVVDLEFESEALQGKSLAEMCEIVLHRTLPKIKLRQRTRDKERKRKGYSVPTAHWRKESMTKIMKQYASQDVSSGIDVWMKSQGLSM